MTQEGWLQLATTILTVLSTCFTAWLLAKYGRTQDIINNLHQKTEKVIEQNAVQEQKIDAVHVEINSRLAEYIKAAVKAALQEGLAQGVEQERKRTEGLKK